MRIVITSGPSYEPLDKVRRLTNFSTGELGTLLAEAFTEAGHHIVLFRSIISSHPAPKDPVEVIPFATNDDLANGLRELPARDEVTMVFHVAALCDYRVAEITDANGETVSADKMSSRAGSLKLTLEPTPKLIASLRRLFPASIIVGWKYEMEGSKADVIAEGRKQIDEYLNDACVVNGHAYGSGFGVLSRTGDQTHLPDKATLCRFLVDWAERTPMAMVAPGQQSFHALSTFNSLSPFI